MAPVGTGAALLGGAVWAGAVCMAGEAGPMLPLSVASAEAASQLEVVAPPGHMKADGSGKERPSAALVKPPRAGAPPFVALARPRRVVGRLSAVVSRLQQPRLAAPREEAKVLPEMAGKAAVAASK